MGSIFLIQINLFRLDIQDTAFVLHCICRIGEEVHDDLVDLNRICHDRCAVCAQTLPDLDGRGQRCPQQLDGFFYDGGNTDSILVYLGLTAEGEDLLYQVPGPDACLHDLIEFIAEDLPFLLFHLRQAGIAEHRGKDIVEVMGDTACQRTDGFHLLRL